MRIAFSGTHCVGKTTLIELVAEALPGWTTVPEPYCLLEEEGYECSDPPSVEDFEAQLERSLVVLEEAHERVLFDRCPADILAYLLAHDEADAFDTDAWLDRAREALQALDLLVFVPIEQPDRIPLPSYEDRAYRRAVHERLRRLLVDDGLGLEAEVLTVGGDLPARAGQVMARVGGAARFSSQSRRR